MKKILFAIAIVMTMSFSASAQGNDGFFRNWDDSYGNRGDDPGNPSISWGLPEHYDSNDQNGAPLGSGLLVLTALGAGYAVYRKKRS